jgi:hypothetical protein
MLSITDKAAMGCLTRAKKGAVASVEGAWEGLVKRWSLWLNLIWEIQKPEWGDVFIGGTINANRI